MSTIYLQSVGIAAPGLGDWSTATAILRSEAIYNSEPLQLPAPELLPATERRRSSDSVRLALRVAEEALSLDATKKLRPTAIFSSAYGDPTITHKLCDLLSNTPPLASPTLFHNSVHNAPAGYWSIATENSNTTTSIAAGDESFATSLYYAAAQVISEQLPVLLISYDLPYPHPLSEKCAVRSPFASALLLSYKSYEQSVAKLTIALNDAPVSTMDDPELEALRKDNPAARALPLLEMVAHGGGECHIPYQTDQQLRVEISQCL